MSDISESHALIVASDAHITLDQCITAWLAAKTKRTDSPQTKRAYNSVIEQFRAALRGAGLDLDSDVTLIVLAAQGWASLGQDGEDISASTYNQRLAILSSFYRYAVKQKVSMSNPIDIAERRPRNVRHAALPIDAGEIAKILQGIDRSTLEGLRDYALLSVALTTGRRVHELASLRWAHLRFVGAKIVVTWVHCKGGKVMSDELKSKTAKVLVGYLQEVYGARLGSLAADAPIWISLSGNNRRGPISTQAISNICLRRLGTSKVHTLRHSFAVSMEIAGASLSDIGARLGHNDLKTTSEYMKRLHSAENAYASKLEDLFGI